MYLKEITFLRVSLGLSNHNKFKDFIMSITLDNLDQYGIGHNFSDALYPQDFELIVYGNDSEDQYTRDDPEASGGTVAWWKEPSYDRWWKVGPKGTRD